MHPARWMTTGPVVSAREKVLNVVFIGGIKQACMQMDGKPRPTYSSPYMIRI